MAVQRHAIFREKALKHYTQGRKKDVLPRFSSISSALFAWALLGSLIATALVAFYGQVPVFLPGSGIVLGANAAQTVSTQSGPEALAFFTPEQAGQLHSGETVQVQFGASSAPIGGAVVQVLPGTTSLATALAHYGLNVGTTAQQSQQVAVALIKMGAGSPAGDAGSPIIVQVNVGRQSLFSALTGMGMA